MKKPIRWHRTLTIILLVTFLPLISSCDLFDEDPEDRCNGNYFPHVLSTGDFADYLS